MARTEAQMQDNVGQLKSSIVRITKLRRRLLGGYEQTPYLAMPL